MSDERVRVSVRVWVRVKTLQPSALSHTLLLPLATPDLNLDLDPDPDPDLDPGPDPGPDPDPHPGPSSSSSALSRTPRSASERIMMISGTPKSSVQLAADRLETR